MAVVKNQKPSWMRTGGITKVIEGELVIDQKLNDEDMYMFSINGRRIEGIFRKHTLLEYWESKGKPSMNIHVDLCWKQGNARLVTKYNEK